MTDDCVFCKINKGELPAKKVGEGDNFIVIESIDPVSEGHCLIVSKKHYANALELPSLLGSELVTLVKGEVLRLKKEGKADGAKIVQNIGENVAEIQHFHAHVIPEKDGVTREKHV